MIKVGLSLSFRGMWQGGVNYYHNLLSCYQKYPDPGLKIDVFTPFPDDFTVYESDAIEIHGCPELRVRRSDYRRRVVWRLLRHDPVFLGILKRHRIDLLAYNSLGRQTRVNTLLWFPDFQHKVFPQFFSAKECAIRDSKIASTRLWGNILLSSLAAANDFRRFYPELAEVQTRILHFSAPAVLNEAPLSRVELERNYPVREPYFFLPNQFWQHKNHAVVVEALRRTSADIRVICTGSMEDQRNSAYLPVLLDNVKQAGLEGRFICLGVVPYQTLVSLMQHSLAVLQPSLFEGWSTSVEEAKAMCKQIILSNIDVHVEQAPKRGVYFSPDSPDELAACMERIHADFCPVTERSFEEQRVNQRMKIERDWIEDFAHTLKAVAAARR
jgi:glycosyltransferase involved in cell wall biosynthesis